MNGRGRTGTARQQDHGGRNSNTTNIININMHQHQPSNNPFIDVDSHPASVVAATSLQSLQNNPLIDTNSLPASSDFVPNVVSAMTSRASSTITSDSDNAMIAPTLSSPVQLSSQKCHASKDIITILPWPHPFSHYIPIEEEERLLPTLIQRGRKERGMMKDQPESRLQQLRQMLENQRISLVQSLSLRRTHIKLLNSRSRMPELRLGSEDNINDAAAIFERSVTSYLRRHNVEFWTERDQQRIHVMKDRYAKQPPTPDFRMKDGHVVVLDLVHDVGGDDLNNHDGSMTTFSSTSNNHGMSTSSTTNSNTDISSNTRTIITNIHWIEAKMFYGASTIPHGTPNAVGTILSKVKQYVALYGHGALVFMYGCGDQLAQQLLDVGVLALDGRCLDLNEVERHQKRWCSNARGVILF